MKPASQLKVLAVVSLLLLQLITNTQGSGVFEINFDSLVDSYGRDLRDDCCGWLNETQQQNNNNNNFEQPMQSCDPTKCQLIIRVCVKNYQTQIEPTQCTFGELSGLVMRPSDAQLAHRPYLLARGVSTSSAAALQQAPTHSQAASLKPSLFQQRQQPHQAHHQQLLASTNIHHQRMLYQQQLLHTPLFYPTTYKQSISSSQSAAYQQLYPSSSSSRHQQHHQHYQPQQLLLLSGQSRGLRQIAFHQPISFPFNFTWPGSFSLIVDAWYEQQVSLASDELLTSSPRIPKNLDLTTYDLYKKQLIIKHSMHGWLSVKDEWTNDVRRTDEATLAYSYRVVCQPNYYGSQCNLLCKPRDDVYGHYTCSPSGSIECLAGWQGDYCDEPICSPSCHKDHGTCLRPNECLCRPGYKGPSCSECETYPGCEHGTCSKPFQCNCKPNWGGLLCNEDLKYCDNHQPCQNGAICNNVFSVIGAGSYNCTCPEGFSGVNCEISGSLNASSLSSSSSSATTLIVDALPVITTKPVAGSGAPSASFLSGLNSHAGAQHQQRGSPMRFIVSPASMQLDAGSLDGRLVTVYGIFIAGMILVLVCLLLRIFLDRITRTRSFHQDTSEAENVAALQNQQNIYKSRGSLSADKMPFAIGDSLDQLSGTTSCGTSTTNSSRATTLNRLDAQRLQQQQQQRQQQQHQHHQIYLPYHHRSYHSLHQAAMGGAGALQPAGGGASTASGPNNPPPPPYTISHTHPNSTYVNYHHHYAVPPQPTYNGTASLYGPLNPGTSAVNLCGPSGSRPAHSSTAALYGHLPARYASQQQAAAAMGQYAGTASTGSPYSVIFHLLEVEHADQQAAAQQLYNSNTTTTTNNSSSSNNNNSNSKPCKSKSLNKLNGTDTSSKG